MAAPLAAPQLWGVEKEAAMKSATLAPIALALALAAPAHAKSPTPVERGKYLVAIMGCNDCHTPLKMGPNGPEPDESRYLSGHPQEVGPLAPAASHGPANGPWMWQGAATNTAYTGPWGVTYTANLTPDVNTGIGIWTEEMFVKTIKTGKHWGVARPIQPPMPWPAYRNASEDDLKAIYAYLRTIKPIKNLVPDYQPPVESRVAVLKPAK